MISDSAGHDVHGPSLRAAGGSDTVVGTTAEAAAAAAAAIGGDVVGPAGPGPHLPHLGGHAGRWAHPHDLPGPGAHGGCGREDPGGDAAEGQPGQAMLGFTYHHLVG